jgi:hypothetical protein
MSTFIARGAAGRIARKVVTSVVKRTIPQARTMAGGPGVTYEGLTLYPAGTKHKVLATVLGATAWSWFTYRMYHDYRAVFFGDHAFMHDDDHHEEHADKAAH